MKRNDTSISVTELLEILKHFQFFLVNVNFKKLKIHTYIYDFTYYIMYITLNITEIIYNIQFKKYIIK